MIKKVVFAFATVALAVASAATYRITLHQSATLNGTELKPGQYKVELDGTTATFLGKDTNVKADVKVESTEAKNGNTSIRYSNDNGAFKIKEIRLGGTTTKLVFN